MYRSIWDIACKTRAFKRQTCNRGQGVVEYAGALVIAAIIVAAGIIIVPPAFQQMFALIYTQVGSFLSGALPS